MSGRESSGAREGVIERDSAGAGADMAPAEATANLYIVTLRGGAQVITADPRSVELLMDELDRTSVGFLRFQGDLDAEGFAAACVLRAEVVGISAFLSTDDIAAMTASYGDDEDGFEDVEEPAPPPSKAAKAKLKGLRFDQ
jgi:hypothetical protein